MPADTIVNETGEPVGEPVDVLFRDGQWHHARILARWKDRHGREVVQLEWFAELATWSDELLADSEKIREV